MGIADWLMGMFSSKKTPREAVDEAGLALLRQTRAQHIRGFVGFAPVGPAGPDDLLSSRVGGPIALPPEQGLPTDEQGKPLIFLLQLNFEHIPQLGAFPSSGLLQFFIQDNDAFGCAFPSTQRHGFQVLYHTDLKDFQPHQPFAEQLPECHPFADEAFLREGVVLTATAGEMKPNLGGVELDDLWAELLDHFNRATWDAYYAETGEEPNPEIYIGGHPDFTQEDPRLNEEHSRLDTCILQVSSDELFMWGDVGMANFFMTEEDLRHRRFENAVYNWDCS